tara:strand:+ start:2735 stop:2926 length:192 start_codon:yes stop_codon:yes gene_type:complete
MEATVRVTYEITVIRDNTKVPFGYGESADEFREYIQDQLYRTNDIGFDHEADEVDVVIEIDEE